MASDPDTVGVVSEVGEQRSRIAHGFLWTTGIYATSIGVRFLTSVVLSRLLAPEILGVVVIAQTVRIGADLLGDLGLEQSVIRSEHGDDERFLNTAWTMQLLRGAILSIACAVLAPVFARMFGVDVAVMLAIAAAPMLNALASTSVFSIARRLDIKGRNLFELMAETIGLVINVSLAIAMPTVWAPVLGILLTVIARSAITYLLPRPRHRLLLDHRHARDLIAFGKWVALSSASLYATAYSDRFFLGGLVSLELLGIFGLARAIADLPNVLANRLGYLIIFPVVAADRATTGTVARGHLAPVRRQFLALAAIGIATGMAWSDHIVALVYDSRYHAAGWMLFLLFSGSWFAVLSAFNEAVVLGRSRPQAISAANLVRITCLIVGLNLGFVWYGLVGAILALTVAELVRYAILVTVVHRMKLGFLRTDAAITLGLAIVLAGWIGLRLLLDLGWPLAAIT